MVVFRIFWGAGVVGLLLASGCMSAPVMPPPGILFNHFQAPLDTDADKTAMGGSEGRASCINILGLVAVGDASVAAAAEDGGIGVVDHIDYDYLSVLGVFQRYTTIVKGSGGLGGRADDEHDYRGRQ